MITPIEFGVVQRTNDISMMKQNEDIRPQIDQMNAQVMDNQKAVIKHEHVINKDNADRENTNYDAKEKGSNSYYGSQQRKKKKEENDGKVKKIGSCSFDVRA